MMNKTLDYYNQTAREFIRGTIDADFSALHQRFLSQLPEHGHILDLGCGSGRDAKAFLDLGYTVTAIDGSPECCRLAGAYIGQPVLCLTFDALDFDQAFDGIWACASLLHVPYGELTAIFLKLVKALKPGGILYASFKYGDFEGDRNGRYFTDLDEERLKALLEPVVGLTVVETFITRDVRDGRDGEIWLNVIGKKTDNISRNGCDQL
ncbi:methyltransferase domain-containing protein [Acetobacterium paludosum]|uniref:Methyltransferase domain-containing protein n=1 Tax=Acetobacterium paludosum TaxID=52693 RepID=A0A923KP61_9FIRM|nr:class I SAM-dependent methyltransferase [Acetobacterium paludosum]MBC3887809.1 methyltransferase domain-containing protein [Acetobacterium paludosum]